MQLKQCIQSQEKLAELMEKTMEKSEQTFQEFKSHLKDLFLRSELKQKTGLETGRIRRSEPYSLPIGPGQTFWPEKPDFNNPICAVKHIDAYGFFNFVLSSELESDFQTGGQS